VLSYTHFVVTAETRELFDAGVDEKLPAAEVAPQVQDIFALLDHSGSRRAM
jgi:hypothetical protein